MPPSTARRDRGRSEEWEDDETTPPSSDVVSPVKRPATPGRRPIVRSRPGARTTASPKSPKAVKVTRAPEVERRKPVIIPSPARPAKVDRSGPPPWVRTILSSLFETVLGLIRLTHAILSPVYPYLFLVIAVWIGGSFALSYLPGAISSIIYQAAGRPLRYLLHSASSDTDVGRSAIDMGRRGISTPICALTGQLCGLSLLSRDAPARPFWMWSLVGRRAEVDVGRVAREMAREVQGAKDIFDSLALLTGGGMVDRAEHVRIWELSVAVQVGSGLEEREVVSEQLVHLGNVARDLSEALIETNVMAVDSFTWLQWEFSALVKALRSPPQSRPSAEKLAARLNALLSRLSESLDKLHSSASHAYILAQKGSSTGQTLRTRLNPVVEDLRGQHERAPGWKLAVDKGRHFITGGEISKTERISRDLSITEDTIASLSTTVRGLEETRLGIKTFASQIGYFQASMVGYHLGAGEHVGVGPEEEIEMLAGVVSELGRSVSRAKGREELLRIE